MYPFYRMDILALDIKINLYTKSWDLRVNHQDTDYISIQEVEKAFCTSPAWKDQWPQVEALLKTSAFKSFSNQSSFMEKITEMR